MKRLLVVMLICMLCFVGCSDKKEEKTDEKVSSTTVNDVESNNQQVNSVENVVTNEKRNSTGRIYLYGEAHGIEKILDKEYEEWCNYYEKQGMRHLFVELPYYSAEYLNLWMQDTDDEILEQLFRDVAGTP